MSKCKISAINSSGRDSHDRIKEFKEKSKKRYVDYYNYRAYVEHSLGDTYYATVAERGSK